ncbi:hypothetical protein M3215_10530 [Bacillus cytotoxicus]|uniref:Uncharacterized protein n=1 Tax=Bacillus cytotoxicus TaxID=580165 RepID=A0ACC6A6P6_9BACI|nr:hypothetical protein [Bacillus cytotoxicus]
MDDKDKKDVFSVILVGASLTFLLVARNFDSTLIRAISVIVSWAVFLAVTVDYIQDKIKERKRK